jgi:hypothetical protein
MEAGLDRLSPCGNGWIKSPPREPKISEDAHVKDNPAPEKAPLT